MSKLDFRAVFDASANAYMLLDRDLRYVAANRAYLEVTGSQLTDLVGRYVFDLFPHDPADANNLSARTLRESFEKVLSTRARHVIPLLTYSVARVPGGEPETRLWSATHEPILDEHGDVAYILQNTVDVTVLARESAAEGQTELSVLRRAEQTSESNRALGDQIADLRNVFDQAPGFVAFLRGPEHVFEIANHAYAALIGHRPLIGKPIREALPDLAGQGYFELLDQVFRTAKPFVGHDMRVQLDRSEHGPDEAIVDFVYQPIRHSEGHVFGILVQGNDVTEHRRHESRQRFLTRAGEGLSIATRDLAEALRQLARAAVPDFADWAFVDLLENGSYRRLFAFGPDSDNTELAERALQFSLRFGSDSAFGQALAASGPTLFARLGDDARLDIAQSPEHLALMRELDLRSLCVVPLRSDDQPVGVLTLGFGKSLRRYDPNDSAVAEELARICTIALDNDRLSRERDELLHREQAARERAEAANQAKDEFLAMLGHELRNPLAPILTAVQLMKLREGAQASREQVIIERQANHLVRLVDDLLDVSRIARGKVELRAVATDIAAAVAKAVEIASPLLEQRRHELQVDLGPRPLMVFGDEDRLAQVIANLLTNAARYTPLQGLVRLSAEDVEDRVLIRVSDNGIGITADLLPRIFDLFVQGPQHSDRSTGGLGLGLTLVRNLVAAHGGTVEAHSAGPDQGSEFVIRLPALQPARPSQPPSAAVTRARSPAPPGVRVLVVDDNVDAAELLAALLERHGYETALAFDGPSALQEVARFAPAIAILDIGLPVMDGYELATRLRTEQLASLPQLIALTGYGQAYDHARSHAAGFFAHLVKPVDAELLLRTVSDAQSARVQP